MSFFQLRSRTLNPLTTAPPAAASTLTAESGNVTWSGTAAGLRATRILSADPGSVAWTGTAAGLNKGHTLTAAAGAVTWTGTAAALSVTMPAESGSLTVTGTAAGLIYGAITATEVTINPEWAREYPRAFSQGVFGRRRFDFVNNYVLSAGSGSFATELLDANLVYFTVQTSLNQLANKGRKSWPRHFAPGPWGHLTGVKSLNRAGYAGANNAALAADPGTFTWTGTAATLLFSKRLTAETGNYSWSVSAANLHKGRLLVAAAGSFVITAPSAALRASIRANTGAWIWTGSDANLLYSNAPEETGGGGMLLMGVG